MKLLIISAGPGMDEIRNIYGHAIDWISSFLIDKSLDISINHIYKNKISYPNQKISFSNINN